MAQGVLPFKYESGKSTTGMTAPAGLPAYLDKDQDYLVFEIEADGFFLISKKSAC